MQVEREFSLSSTDRVIYVLFSRKKSCVIDEYGKCMDINSAEHIRITVEQTTVNTLTDCPNATELTLDYNEAMEFDKETVSSILSAIVPLNQLTKLHILVETYLFKVILELLVKAPNIHTLTIGKIYFEHDDFTRTRQTEFQKVSARSHIENLNIHYTINEQNEMQLFFDLCPRLQNLTMSAPHHKFEEIMRYVISRNLVSVGINQASPEAVESMKNLIESKEIMHGYAMKTITQDSSYDIYLWR